MEIHDYLRIMRRNWMWTTSVTLVGLLVGAVVSVLTPPTYTAETQLFVSIQGSGSIQELQQGNTFGQARVQSYVKTVDSPLVLQPAIDALGIEASAESLAGRVTATNDLNTVLITISVSDGSGVQAAAIAEAVGNSLIAAVDSLEKPKVGGSSPISLSVIKPATVPPNAASPDTRANLFLGLVAGLALGIGSSFLRATIDSRIRGEADMRRVTNKPLLGGIAFDQDATRKPLLTQSAAQSPRAESFRQIRTNLQFANVSGKAKTILVTSSIPGEGKSTTATNLAISIAQAGQSVCLIDADLRRPSVSEYLGLERNVGLTTALVGAADVDEILQPWGDDQLFVLTSGQIPPNPSELLGSREMQQLILRLEQVFDTVIVDAPPLLPVTDAVVLSQHVGGVVVVAGAQRLTRHELEKSLESLDMVEAHILGIVLNLIPSKGPDAYGYGSYSYGTLPDTNETAEQGYGRDSVDHGQFSAVTTPEQDFVPRSHNQGVRVARTLPKRSIDRV